MFRRLDAVAPGLGAAAYARVTTRLGHAPNGFASNLDIQVSVHELNLTYLDLLQGLPVTASAGLSLGEYAHLVAIGALDADHSRDLVAARGAAYDEGPSGCMAAVQPIDPDEAITLCTEICARFDDAEAVAVSNFNSPTQCVVAGRADAVDAFMVAAEERFFAIGRIIEDRICMHMPRFRPVSESFALALAAAEWRVPSQSYWANVTAQPAMADAAIITDCLTRHVYQPVLWRQTMEAFHITYPDAVFIEVGPLQILSKMMGRRWLPQATVFALDPMEFATPSALTSKLEAIHAAIAA
ncbi:acyltransferase domain-containing protein [Asticcacaulis sp. BYS171W]|uniref:[acyl-carrier-protein] S-malonyltransferase n=1 Tax=Asticcacaulis aquaticus TaxID=2984212 RepID=A0ABT5HUI9_9CAUL|nr:acyltransferase domain-containing protein [Asticcacaulis aquaticus]MDC7683740.1 acyltransferase domain-containing protein [Asticcacaulis aquaticus]